MHKRHQPVKLWYLSSFFRHERAQAGRYRQFWQVGAEALGSEDPAVDAESIVLLATLLGRDGRARDAAAAVEPRQQRERGEYRERLQAHLRAHEASLSEDVREPDRAEPAARVRLRPRGHEAGDGERAAPARPAQRGGRRALRARCARCSTWRTCPTRSTRRSCAAWTTTRGRCSSSHPMRSARRAAWAVGDATTAWWSKARPPRTAHPWHGLGGGGRADPAGGRATTGRGEPGRAVRGARRHPARHARGGGSLENWMGRAGERRAAFGLLAEARSAGLTAQMELAGRSLKGQLGYADALGRSLCGDRGDGRDGAEGHAGRWAGADRHGHGRARGAARSAHALRTVTSPGLRASKPPSFASLRNAASKAYCPAQLLGICRKRGDGTAFPSLPDRFRGDGVPGAGVVRRAARAQRQLVLGVWRQHACVCVRASSAATRPRLRAPPGLSRRRSRRGRADARDQPCARRRRDVAAEREAFSAPAQTSGQSTADTSLEHHRDSPARPSPRPESTPATVSLAPASAARYDLEKVPARTKPTGVVGTPAQQVAVESELKRGKVVVLLFWNPKACCRRVAVRKELQAAGQAAQGWPMGRSRCMTRSPSRSGRSARSPRAIQVYETPTILLVNRHGVTTTLTGLTDVYSIEQTIEEARHA